MSSSSKRRLAAYVHVHQEDGSVHIYGPADDVPPEDAAKITNPKAWVEPEPEPVVETQSDSPAETPKARPAKKSASKPK